MTVVETRLTDIRGELAASIKGFNPELVQRIDELTDETLLAVSKALVLSREVENTFWFDRIISISMAQCPASDLNRFFTTFANCYLTCSVDFHRTQGSGIDPSLTRQVTIALLLLEDEHGSFTEQQKYRLAMIVMAGYWLGSIETVKLHEWACQYGTPFIEADDSYLTEYVRSEPTEDEFKELMALLCGGVSYPRFVEAAQIAEGKTMKPLTEGVL